MTLGYEQMRAILAEINALCHVPTPKGMRADTHFQRDFDRIRALTAPYVVGELTHGGKE